MGVYVITGGKNGIGKATVDVLLTQGHTVYSIDYEGGDITADLSKPVERQRAIDEIHRLCPDGIDGLACIAGIAAPKGRNSSVIAVNYYGTVKIAEGLFPLLLKKNGTCIITTSGSISWSKDRSNPSFFDVILSCDEEERVLALADSLDFASGYNFYGISKVAVAKWARRHSIEWGLRGVRLAIVAPGCIDTRLSAKPEGNIRVNESFHMTIPMFYKSMQEDEHLVPAVDLGEVYAFLLSPEARSCAGSIFYVDGGQEAFNAPDKLYF